MPEFDSAIERKVLVVDDEESIRLALEIVLEDAGFVPISASSAEEAVAAIAQHSFGVAVVDKNLPGGVSGLEILSHIHSVNASIKVILHTGFPSTKSAIAALRQGAFDYLPKPTENDLIVEKVKLAWESYASERERTELFHNYETLFEVVPGIVWFLTDDGEFRRTSQKGAAMLGYSSEELLGQSYEKLLAPGSHETSAHWAFKERRTGERATRRQVITMVAKDGSKRIFEVSSSAAYEPQQGDDAGHYQGTLVVGIDVTDQMGLLEHLQENSKMEALGRMAGGGAHDFNNALSVIIASAQSPRAFLSYMSLATMAT